MGVLDNNGVVFDNHGAMLILPRGNHHPDSEDYADETIEHPPERRDWVLIYVWATF